MSEIRYFGSAPWDQLKESLPTVDDMVANAVMQIARGAPKEGLAFLEVAKFLHYRETGQDAEFERIRREALAENPA